MTTHEEGVGRVEPRGLWSAGQEMRPKRQRGRVTHGEPDDKPPGEVVSNHQRRAAGARREDLDVGDLAKGVLVTVGQPRPIGPPTYLVARPTLGALHSITVRTEDI